MGLGTNGINGTNGRTIDGTPLAHDAEMAWREAQGASQIGPFDFVPPPWGSGSIGIPVCTRRKWGPKSLCS